jgi:hypothetical protein
VNCGISIISCWAMLMTGKYYRSKMVADAKEGSSWQPNVMGKAWLIGNWSAVAYLKAQIHGVSQGPACCPSARK